METVYIILTMLILLASILFVISAFIADAALGVFSVILSTIPVCLFLDSLRSEFINVRSQVGQEITLSYENPVKGWRGDRKVYLDNTGDKARYRDEDGNFLSEPWTSNINDGLERKGFLDKIKK